MGGARGGRDHRLHGEARRRRGPVRAPRGRCARRASRARVHAVERGGSDGGAARPPDRQPRGARDPGPAPDGGGRRSRGERPCGAGRRVAGRRHRRPRRVRRGHVRHQGPGAVLPARLPGEARASHRHGGSLDLREAVARDDPSARGGAASSERRARRVHGRSRLGGERDGGGLRALRRAPARSGRPHLRRGLRRHRAGHGRHAQPADRRAQDDGVLGRVGRCEALRRPLGHLHDVFGHRRGRHQPDLGARARQRGARPGGHDRLRARAGDGLRREARHRAHDVRRDDAVRADRRQGARGPLRLPRVPRDGNRRPVDGEARGLGPPGGRDRRDHHGDRGRDRRRRAVRGSVAPGRDHQRRGCPMSAPAAPSTW